eukprot:5071352-Prymnesium_polylepis.1
MRSARIAAARDRRAVGSMHHHRLHAAVDPPVHQLARPVRAYESALQSRWPAQPVSVVQNVSGDGAAEPHHLADHAGDRAGSLDDDEQCEP